jgi:LuxR family transcriptional regulator, maltose regulon positive regulatory protein
MYPTAPTPQSEPEQVENCAENSGPDTPIATAKVRIPATASTVLVRRRLHDLLDAAVIAADGDPPVTVVCAPAGAGKTTALATWARGFLERGDTGVAWVSLDSEDNDPGLLWSAVLRALEVAGSGIKNGSFGRLAAQQGEPDSAFLTAAILAFERLAKPVVVVLDGVHEVHSVEAVHTLNTLLRHLPATLRVVLAMRFPPALILPRLKLEGRLREIGPDDLSFTTDEARLMYATAGIRLTETELALLMERTEGWAAGLRLAAITLADSARPSEFIRDFTGDDPVVADYLIGEVLPRYPEDVQQFLLSTCVCRAFTAELAAALSQQENAGQILDGLERTNILVSDQIGTDRWYRYHPLLRGYLRAELRRRRLSAMRQLHRVAAEWFVAAGDPLCAMEHGIAAEDDDLVTQLVAKFGLEQVLKGEATGLQRILHEVQAHVLARPSVALVAATTALDLGDPQAADRYLSRVTSPSQTLRTRRMRALQAVVQLHRSRLAGDRRSALTPTLTGRTGDVDVDLLVLFNRGVVAAWTGRHRVAKANLRRALRLATTEQRDAVVLQCMAHLAALAAAEGDLAQMGVQARSAVDFAETRGWARTSRCAYLYTLLAAEAHERLEGERARAQATLATDLLAESVDPTIELFARTVRAMVNVDIATEPHEIVATLRGHWQRLGDKALAPSLVAYAAPILQRMALRVGEYQWAVEVLEQVEDLLAAHGEYALLRATLNAHKGKVSSTRRLLAPVVNGEVRTLVAHSQIDVWLLEAHLAHRSDDGYRAHEAVSQALAAAEPRYALQRFRAAGQSVRALLAQGTGRFGRLEPFAAKVLSVLPASGPDLTDALTEREQALLTELPSMRTAEEIAHGLFVSVNTVKTHLRGIYRKLGVNHRRDAITVARQRGLL